MSSTGRPTKSRLRALPTVDRAHEHSRARESGRSSINPLGWERSGEVSVHVHAGKPITSAEGAQIIETEAPIRRPASSDVRLHVLHVPALGYKVVWLGAGKARRTASESDVAAKHGGNSITLESDILRVTVDKQSGCITSLSDKKATSRRSPKAPAAISCSSSRTLRRITTRGTSIPAHSTSADDHRSRRLRGTS